MSNIGSNVQNSLSNAVQSIPGMRNNQQQQIADESFTKSMSPSIYNNFNLNTNTNSFDNHQTRNVFEIGKNDFSNESDRTKSLLSMSPDNYPMQIEQDSSSALDHKNSFTKLLQSYRNDVFGGSSSTGQFSSATKFGGQPNEYNSQLPSGQLFSGPLNTLVNFIPFH